MHFSFFSFDVLKYLMWKQMSQFVFLLKRDAAVVRSISFYSDQLRCWFLYPPQISVWVQKLPHFLPWVSHCKSRVTTVLWWNDPVIRTHVCPLFTLPCLLLQGYVKRQAVFACSTCTPDAAEPAGICLACANKCHDGHDIFELYTKR